MSSKRYVPQFILKRLVFSLVFLLAGWSFGWGAGPNPGDNQANKFVDAFWNTRWEMPVPQAFFGQGQGTPDAGAPSVQASPVVEVGYSDMVSTLSIVIFSLLGVVVLLVFITINLSSLIRIREGKEGYTLKGCIQGTLKSLANPYINTAAGFVSVIIALFLVVPYARTVGFSQGYKPEQPIKFSHKTHAGDFAIDCQYCHSGASKGKNAWIPSTNVCMNCHKAIKEGSRYGTTEISKIYAAVENNQPVKWIRIHNLPDFVYFNHQQHVVAGKVECQTCHGPIQEMEVVYQFSPLSMGWCVNCHRSTELQKDLYAPEKVNRPDAVHVEDIGGLECARCHY